MIFLDIFVNETALCETISSFGQSSLTLSTALGLYKSVPFSSTSAVAWLTTTVYSQSNGELLGMGRAQPFLVHLVVV